MLRPEEALLFAYAERVVADVIERTTRRADVRTVVLSLEESADLDSTAVVCLLELDQRLRERQILLVLSRVKEPVREPLQRCDPQRLGRDDRLYWSVADAVRTHLQP